MGTMPPFVCSLRGQTSPPSERLTVPIPRLFAVSNQPLAKDGFWLVSFWPFGPIPGHSVLVPTCVVLQAHVHCIALNYALCCTEVALCSIHTTAALLLWLFFVCMYAWCGIHAHALHRIALRCTDTLPFETHCVVFTRFHHIRRIARNTH